MSQLITSRRSFLVGFSALIAAPAIVRAGSLMPVKQMPSIDDLNDLFKQRIDESYKVMANNINGSLYGAYGDEFHRIHFYDGAIQLQKLRGCEVFKGRMN